MTSRHRFALLALVTCAAVSAPAVSHAQPTPAIPSDANKAEASAHFRRGVDFYKENDFRSALMEFRRANDLVPNNLALYNVARCWASLHEYAKATTAFEKYLIVAADELDAEKRKVVETEIARLSQHVARIELKANLEGADVEIDGEPSGKTPVVGSFVVDTGKHRITASKAGFDRAEKFVEVAAHEKIVLELELKPTPSQSVSPIVIAPDPSSHDGRTTAAWITGIGTGVFAIATIAVGGLALAAHSDLTTKNDTYPQDATDLRDTSKRAKNLALAADILGVATLAAGATTAILILTRPKEKEVAKTGVTFDVGPFGVSARGTF